MNTEKNKNENLEENIAFLDSVMDKATRIILHFDNQSNILIGISVAISAFAISNIGTDKISFMTLAVFSIIATVVALYAVHPPRFMRKKGQEESLLYNRKIISYEYFSDYTKEILSIVDDRDAIITEYTKEIYNIYKYHYKPKRFLFKVSRNFLVAGILLFFILFIL